MDEKFPERIWCAQKGEYGRGLDAVELRTWSEKREYHEVFGEVEYVRADCIPDPTDTMKEVVEVVEFAGTYIGMQAGSDPDAFPYLERVRALLAKLGMDDG